MFSVPVTACELLWAGIPNSEHVRAGALSLQVFHAQYTTALQERSLSSQVIACTNLIFREFRTGMRHTSLSATPPQQVDVRFTAVLVRIVCDGYTGDHATVLRLIRCVTRLLAPQDINAEHMFRSSDLSDFLSTVQGKCLSLALTINIKRYSVIMLTTLCTASLYAPQARNSQPLVARVLSQAQPKFAGLHSLRSRESRPRPHESQGEFFADLLREYAAKCLTGRIVEICSNSRRP